MNIRRGLILWVLAFGIVTLTACSSDQQTADSGGTGGTGMAMGTVTGFGSVFVNGIEYQTDAATNIKVDGETVPSDPAQYKSRLALGMVVRVDAERAGTVWTAKSIEYRSDLIGPVASPNLTTKTFTVLGERVTVTADTKLDGLTAFGDLQPDQMVRVTGFPSDAGFTATRISWDGITIWTPDTTVMRRGLVAVAAEGQFRFDNESGVVVNHDDATAVTSGAYARVVGTFDGTNTITATQPVELDPTFGVQGGEFELEGIVTARSGSNVLTVNGYQIETAGVAGADAIAVGDRIEAEGTVESTGLVADTIELRRESAVELVAPLQAHDAGAGTVTLIGRTFVINATTAIANKDTFFSDITDDTTWLKVHAYQSATGDHIATEAEIVTETGLVVKLEGPAADVNTTGLSLAIDGIEAKFTTGTIVPSGYDNVDAFLQFLFDNPNTEVALLCAWNSVTGLTVETAEFDE